MVHEKVKTESVEKFSRFRVKDKTTSIDMFVDEKDIVLKLGSTKTKVKFSTLLQAVADAFENGEFYLEESDDICYMLENERDQLRRELEHGRTVLLNR
jgi:hypothetical protein